MLCQVTCVSDFDHWTLLMKPSRSEISQIHIEDSPSDWFLDGRNTTGAIGVVRGARVRG